MARQISEMHSLPFYQIVGASLLALVQGQAQAAQATAEFIERVGFVGAGETPNGEADEVGNHLGQLRMAKFSYQKRADDGTAQTSEVEIPILSMIPIPGIQIKEADLEFFVKITDIQKEAAQTAVHSENGNNEEWLAPSRVEFRAAMGRMESAASTTEHRIDFQMKVSMKVEQAEIPTGLAHLFRVMDQAITGESSATK